MIVSNNGINAINTIYFNNINIYIYNVHIQFYISRLIDVIRDLAPVDWQLGGVACQVLWNYSVKITSSNACFGEQEAKDLSYTLTCYISKLT